MTNIGKKERTTKLTGGGGGGGGRRRSQRLMTKEKSVEISRMSTPNDHSQWALDISKMEEDLTSLQQAINMLPEGASLSEPTLNTSTPNDKTSLPEGASPSEPTSNTSTRNDKTSLVHDSKPQSTAQSPHHIRIRNITCCINSVMSGQRSPTREWNHAPCSGRQSPVQLLEEGNKKRKLIAGNATLTDQSSFLGSSTDRMEEDPTTFQIMKSTPRETRNPWDLSQDGGSTSNGHSSQMPAPTDREQSKNLLEKFVQMRSVLEKDRNTLQFLQTQIQHDAAAGAGRVKPEPIVIDLDDDCCSGYIVRMKYEHTLRMIISIHGDIAQDCSFTSSDIRKRLLEKACDIYKDLEASNIFDIDVSKMSSICLDLTELQQAKIDVKCLQDRVVKMVELTEELTKAVLFRQTIREEEEKLEKLQVDFKEKKALVEGYKTEAEFYKSRLATLEDLIKEEEEELELIPEPRVTDVLTQCLESWDTWMKKFKPILSSSDY